MAIEPLTLSIDDLKIEYQMMKNELTRLDDLYQEVKSEKQEVKRTARGGATVFTAQQNQVLNSIATSRISVISKLADIRRSMEDMKLKEFNANKALNAEGGVDSALMQELLANIFTMKDDDIATLVATQQVAESDSHEAEAQENLLAAAELIDSFTEEVKEGEVTPEDQYQLLQDVADREALELVYDISSSSFKAISTAVGDAGTLLEDEYLEKHAKEVVDLLSTLEVTVALEQEVAITPIKNFPLVEIC